MEKRCSFIFTETPSDKTSSRKEQTSQLFRFPFEDGESVSFSRTVELLFSWVDERERKEGGVFFPLPFSDAAEKRNDVWLV